MVPLNQWSHIAGVYRNDTDILAVAVNGDISWREDMLFAGNFSTDPNYKFGIGDYNTDLAVVSQAFSGKIDSVRISNIVRYTENFVTEESFLPDENTVALWNFDEPAGSTSFVDASGNGYTLTAFGNATTGY